MDQKSLLSWFRFARNIRKSLKLDSEVPDDRIKVEVHHEWPGSKG